MKSFKIILSVLALFLLTSCGENTVFFINWKDVIALCVLALLVLVIGIAFLIDWIKKR